MITEVQVSSWGQALHIASKLAGHAFRGQEDATWGLSSSIERAAQKWNHFPDMLHGAERIILRHFQRRAHQYIPSPPAPTELLEWLAIVQHYGGPTRLVDFTHSFYIASFFAMERAVGDAAVWAVSIQELQKRLLREPDTTGEETRQDFQRRVVSDILRAERHAVGLTHVEPLRLDSRMTIQQGLFLFPHDIAAAFEENLCGAFNISEDDLTPHPLNTNEDLRSAPLVKFIFPRDIHRDCLFELSSMNITAATLFPGLDGFARSLHLELRSFDHPNYLRAYE
jgi:hypothetical protein